MRRCADVCESGEIVGVVALEVGRSGVCTVAGNFLTGERGRVKGLVQVGDM